MTKHKRNDVGVVWDCVWFALFLIACATVVFIGLGGTCVVAKPVALDQRVTPVAAGTGTLLVSNSIKAIDLPRPEVIYNGPCCSIEEKRWR